MNSCNHCLCTSGLEHPIQHIEKLCRMQDQLPKGKKLGVKKEKKEILRGNLKSSNWNKYCVN